jgi:hypothetical protein
MSGEADNQEALSKDDLFALALKDALEISDRFAREPVLGPTGQGSYKSAGVEGMEKDRAYLESLLKDHANR